MNFWPDNRHAELAGFLSTTNGFATMRYNYFWLVITALIFQGASAQDDVARRLPQPHLVHGIENVWQISPELFSGGEPGSFEGLAKLKAMGIKSIVTVDGARPDVENARKLGLRYVHIPFGYDTVPAQAQLLLVRSFKELPKPIYIHCHHGKHRGPAGAGIMLRSGPNWSAEAALKFMKDAGTSTDYAGLYSSVKMFEPLSDKALAASTEPLPETVEVADMVEMMVQIDTRFDRLKAWLQSTTANQLKSSVGKPVDPHQEAIQMRELVREAARLPECRDQPEAFRKSFDNMEMDLTQWIELFKQSQTEDAPLSPEKKSQLTVVLKQATNRCNTCHKAFRN